jgi:hypothetical protein
MDLDRPSDRLALCGMATFHTVVLVTILITGLHFNDSLGHALGSLSTASGLGLFSLLWITTWWSTRKYVRGLGNFLDLAVKTPVNEIVHKAGSGGALNGLLLGGTRGYHRYRNGTSLGHRTFLLGIPLSSDDWALDRYYLRCARMGFV